MPVILYSYFRSSCSARVRIALNLKGISYDTIPVNLLKGEQLSGPHKALNPSASVPLLVFQEQQGKGSNDAADFKITQSLAALEYLEEVFPEEPILPAPSDPRARATARALANIVCCDTQPVTNLRIMRRVRALGGSAEDWNRELMQEGLRAYETVAAGVAGKYSVGDAVTIADICLLPAVWNAQRFSVDLSLFPTILKVVENLQKIPAIVDAHYFNQPDTPEELRSELKLSIA